MTPTNREHSCTDPDVSSAPPARLRTRLPARGLPAASIDTGLFQMPATGTGSESSRQSTLSDSLPVAGALDASEPTAREMPQNRHGVMQAARLMNPADVFKRESVTLALTPAPAAFGSMSSLSEAKAVPPKIHGRCDYARCTRPAAMVSPFIGATSLVCKQHWESLANEASSGMSKLQKTVEYARARRAQITMQAVRSRGESYQVTPQAKIPLRFDFGIMKVAILGKYRIEIWLVERAAAFSSRRLMMYRSMSPNDYWRFWAK